MSSPEILNKFYSLNTKDIPFQPSRMATDIRIPEGVMCTPRITVPLSEEMSPEEMEQSDAYCQKVQKQLEEEPNYKRELFY